MIEIIVFGSPAPQGSKSYKGQSKAGHAILVESSRRVKPWRTDVKDAAERVCRDYALAPLDGPLQVSMVFTMPKPKSAPKTRQTWPDRQPDLSKLLRSTEDALSDAGLWVDDARVVFYEQTGKVFPGEHPLSLDRPGVRIRIKSMAGAA